VARGCDASSKKTRSLKLRFRYRVWLLIAPGNKVFDQGTSGSLVGAFTRFASWNARLAGQPMTFLLAVAVILAWAATGPGLHYSDTWQLVINTGTTIITFLMVFLIQSTQNRDALAVQVKLDELIRALADADNQIVGVEKLPEAEVESMHDKVIAEAGRSQG
jgi:low affinity Fe/Cu permease